MSIVNIDASTLKKKLDDKESFILIDCREDLEWKEGHIQGAKHIPLGRLSDLIEKEIPNKETPIVVQCRSGGRSLRAAQLLEMKGHKTIFNLSGGLLAWMSQHYPVVIDS